MYDELIKALRDPVHSLDCEFCDRKCCYPNGKSDSNCIIIQAADAIEELQKAVLRLEEVSGILDELPMVDQREPPKEE